MKQSLLEVLCFVPIFAVAAWSSPITILPLGDSITAGYSGTSLIIPGGYRNNFYADLTAAGISVQLEGTSNQNPSPLLTAAGQTGNDGFSGYVISGYPLSSYPGGFYPGLSETIGSVFSQFQPEVVLLMIGTNDINIDYDLSGAPARMGALLDEITADDPTVHIVLSTLIMTLDPTLNSNVAAFNQALPAVVASRPNVTLFDSSNLLDLSTDYVSTLHPNQQGYNILGDALAADVESVIAPEPSPLWLAGSSFVSLVLLLRLKSNQ